VWLFHKIKVNVTEHCINQIKIRKKKTTRKKAIFFAIEVFTQMILWKYQWEKAIKINGKNKRKIIFLKNKWYKFIYDYDYFNDEYFLITFIVKRDLDKSIWQIIKILWQKSKK